MLRKWTYFIPFGFLRLYLKKTGKFIIFKGHTSRITRLSKTEYYIRITEMVKNDIIEIELECAGKKHIALIGVDGIIHSYCPICNGMLLGDIKHD